jgi:WD40 repeat protein
MKFEYKIGGTISSKHPSYIKRAVDENLHTNLLQGNFCYVLTSRQMGKSSLAARVIEKLRQDGVKCSWCDASFAGDKENVTANQWYRGLINRWVNDLGLREFVNIKEFWEQHKEFAFSERLDEFVNKVLFIHISSPVVIFVDEIDSTIDLNFTDDFFSWVRYCFNARGGNPNYKRLTFCFAGVATPTDLIKDKTRTSFNIGKLIEPLRFQEDELTPLMEGLQEQVIDRRRVQHEIHRWTGGQPFLTQRLCKLIQSELEIIEVGQEEKLISQVVRNKIVGNWEYNDDPPHLKTIRDRLLQDENKAISLLGLYRQILEGAELGKPIKVGSNHSEVIALRLAGLIVSEEGQLFVYNEIYRRVFSAEWVTKELERLRPYAVSLSQWLANDKDDKYLLTGQVFLDAQKWAVTRQLTTEDSQYLTSSQKLHTEDFQAQAEQIIRRAKKRATRFMVLGVSGLMASVITVYMAWSMYNETLWRTQVDLSSAQLLTHYPESSLQRTIAAIKVGRELQRKVVNSPNPIDNRHIHPFIRRLQQALSTSNWQETNELIDYEWQETNEPIDYNSRKHTYNIQQNGRKSHAHIYNMAQEANESGIITRSQFDVVAISADGQIIVTGGDSGMLRIRRQNGSLISRITGHQGRVARISVSADGQTIVSGSDDKTVKVWRQDGSLISTITGHQDQVTGLEMSANGQIVVSTSDDKTVKIWRRDGSLISTITGHQGRVAGISVSADGQTIVSGSDDKTVKVWRRNGSLISTITGHQGQVTGVAVSADGQTIISGSDDKTVKVWRRNGSLISTITGHQGRVTGVAVSSDGQTIVSGSDDKTVKVWQQDGSLISTLISRDQDQIDKVAVSADGKTIIYRHRSHGSIAVWRRNGSLISTLTGHQSRVNGVAVSTDGQTIVSGSDDKTVKVWRRNGSLISTLTGHQSRITGVTVSADGQTIVSKSDDKTVKVWQQNGSLISTLPRNQSAFALGTIVSADGQTIISKSNSKTFKILRQDGSLISTLTGGDRLIFSIAVSADGQTITSRSWDGNFSKDGMLMGMNELPESMDKIPEDIVEVVEVWRRDGSLISASYGERTNSNKNTNSLRSWFPRNRNSGFGFGSYNNILVSWDGSFPNTTLSGHQGQVNDVAMSADGQTIVSSSDDKTVRVWHFDLDYLLARGCSQIEDYLNSHPKVNRKELCPK